MMAGRRVCRGNGSQATQAAASDSNNSTQAIQEDMPMCRHFNPITSCSDCCGTQAQLQEISRVLDYQNKILAELLQALRGS